jgi:hypothetical protein
MTIFSSSFVEISCGRECVEGEPSKSEIGWPSACLLFAAGGPRLLNDATKLQLHWKSNGKIRRGMEE